VSLLKVGPADRFYHLLTSICNLLRDLQISPPGQSPPRVHLSRASVPFPVLTQIGRGPVHLVKRTLLDLVLLPLLALRFNPTILAWAGIRPSAQTLREHRSTLDPEDQWRG